mgnify:FL=1
MKQKLIFLDIDGTLLPPGEMLIPQSTVEALHKAHANGHKLFLCTGRNLRMTAPLLEYGCFDGAICSAGGYVLCDGQVLVDLPMEPEQCSGLSAVLEQHGVDYTLESRDETFAGPKMTARWKFTADAPDAWQEIARLDTGGITLERVALVPLPLFQDPVEAEAIARAVANSGERCLLGGFIHSSNWDAAAMENLLCSAARWDLDLDLHIDEELSEVSQGLTWLADHLSRHPFPGHICCSHGCALAAGSDEQAAPILRQLAAHLRLGNVFPGEELRRSALLLQHCQQKMAGIRLFTAQISRQLHRLLQQPRRRTRKAPVTAHAQIFPNAHVSAPCCI